MVRTSFLALPVIFVNIGATTVLAQQREVAFEVSTEETRVMLGASVKEDRWRVHSLWLDWRGCVYERVECTFAFEIRRGTSSEETGNVRLDLETEPPHLGRWGIRLRLDEIEDGGCRGVAIIPPHAPDYWHNFFEDLPAVEPQSWGGGDLLDSRHLPEGAVGPSPVAQFRPRYTNEAIRARVSGYGLIRVVIRADGSIDPDNIRILRHLSHGLDESTIEEVLNSWKFRPATSANGKAVPSFAVFETNFQVR